MSDRTTRRDAAKLTVGAPAVLSAAASGEQVAFRLAGAGAWGQSLLAYANQIGFERCVAICDVDEINLSASDNLEVM